MATAGRVEEGGEREREREIEREREKVVPNMPGRHWREV